MKSATCDWFHRQVFNWLLLYPMCLNCQVKLFTEKRSDLEEQQLHLNIGLQKIRETVEQVEELQRSLSIKRNELEEKNNLANAKLKQMVSSSHDDILASG